MFSSYALDDVSTAWPSISEARAKDCSILLCLTPFIPNFPRVAETLPPSSFTVASPLIKSCKAATGLVFHVSAKLCADTPATLAINSRSSVVPSLKSATAVLIEVRVCVMAVPPASAWIPTELIAAASARISVSDSPTIVPADASLVAISVISDSVVAKLFPRATIVDPSLSTFALPVPVIFVNLARAVAASSADKLVVSPSMTIVRVKFSISSADTPSCPAASATPAISSFEDAVSVAICIMAALRSS